MDLIRPVRRWDLAAPIAPSIALAILCTGAARAQTVFDSVRTANGYCHVWQAPPGFSNPSDLSYSSCAIDRQPRRLSGPDFPAPAVGDHAGGSIFIAVRSDGTVDSALTRTSTITGDTSFDHHVLETVRQWRFEPPLREGVPVRAGVWLEISSPSRNDTVPAHLVWRYVETPGQDSAVAQWVADTARPVPLTSTQADSVFAEVFRQLARLQVLLPGQSRRYCLVASSGDTLTARRLERIARIALPRSPAMVMTAGCDRDPRILRFVMPTISRTEGNRVVVLPRGDFLPVWPWGLDAKSWRAWSGRCVGQMLADGRAAMACGVNPVLSASEGLDRLGEPATPAVWNEGDSVRFTILATRSGAFLVDTLHFTRGPLPILEQHAVIDSLIPCGNWAAYTAQTDTVLVVHGPIGDRSLDVTSANHGAAPVHRSRGGCLRRTSTAGPFAAFFLGGVGAAPTAPVHLCFANCAYGYDLDPRHNTLAAAPAAVIRVADLRRETQLGETDVMRILMDHGPSDVAVFVVYRLGARWTTSGIIPRHSGAQRWDFAINLLDDDHAGIEYWVYLFRRPIRSSDSR